VICTFCGAEFRPKRTDAVYCTAKCRAEASLRRRIQGAVRQADARSAPDSPLSSPTRIDAFLVAKDAMLDGCDCTLIEEHLGHTLVSTATSEQAA
jgi:hypothetical protein